MKISIWCLLLFAACQPKPSPDPVAKEVIENYGVSIRSYDFKTFEPFLSRDDHRVHVINFWATWCAPCIEELPHFKKAASHFAGEDVHVLLVSLDMKREVEPSLLPFVEKHGIANLAVHLHEPDADSWIPKVDSQWSGALPATLIYSKGKRKFYERSFTAAELDREIKLFLN